MKFSTTGQEKDDLLKQVTNSLRDDHLGRFDFSYSILTWSIHNSSENVHNYSSVEKWKLIFGTYDFKCNLLKNGIGRYFFITISSPNRRNTLREYAIFACQ
jgi:hypothetical protein